jgi:aminodeoxyfutalosine synthase
MIAAATTSMDDLRARVLAGEWLTAGDGLRLYESPDIFTLGELADAVRRRLHGRNAYYNINRHINYTNYCVLRCKFCSFYRPYPRDRAAGFSPRDPADSDAARPPQAMPPPPLQRGGSGGSVQGGGLQIGEDTPQDDGGYELSIAEIVERAREAYRNGATEVHIVGGLHPKLPFDYYLDMCAAIRRSCPHMHIKAFTAIEIIHFTRIAKPRLSIVEVLTKLREAGLGSMPGGGAEIFDDRVHDEAFKTKVGEAEWFDVHRTAHELGIFTNATMLYGHVETHAERITHLVKLREHQAESLRSRAAHFNCVIPLSFVPDGSALSHLSGPGGLDDLRTLAISRLMCPNIPHIKAFWIMQTPKLAQVSLNWGVDDLDGTVVYYDITKREGGGTTHQELTADKLRRLIVEAGCKPVERDTLYRRVIRDEAAWRIEGESFSVPFSPETGDAESKSGNAIAPLAISR